MPQPSPANAPPLLARMVTPTFHSGRADLTPGEFEAVLTQAQAILNRRCWFIYDFVGPRDAEEMQQYVDGEIEYTRSCRDLGHLECLFEEVDATIGQATDPDRNPDTGSAAELCAVLNGQDTEANEEVARRAQEDAACAARIQAILDGAVQGVAWTIRVRLPTNVEQRDFEKILVEGLAMPAGQARQEYLQAHGVTRLEVASAPDV